MTNKDLYLNVFQQDVVCAPHNEYIKHLEFLFSNMQYIHDNGQRKVRFRGIKYG